jgi:hypothetical protein
MYGDVRNKNGIFVPSITYVQPLRERRSKLNCSQTIERRFNPPKIVFSLLKKINNSWNQTSNMRSMECLLIVAWIYIHFRHFLVIIFGILG